MPNVRLMERTTVTGAYDQGTFGALERVARHVREAHGAPRECFWRIAAKAAVLATGALERGVAFPGNDRPGVMQAGAVRTYLHRYGVATGRRVAVFGNNDDAHRTARDLAAAGVQVAALIDSRPGVTGPAGIPVFAGTRVTGTRGRMGLAGIDLEGPGAPRRLAVDCLAVSGGWDPAVHLACHHGGRPVWREDIAGFVAPEGAVPGLVPAGAAAGVFSTAGCLADGLRAAGEALGALGFEAPSVAPPDAEDAGYAIAPLWHVGGRGRAWLDLQNDVTVKDVRLAARENFRSVEHMKRYTTQGMATDQGKGSNVTALAVLAEATGRSIPETGTTPFRPPYVPVAIAAMGAGASGPGFAPERRTTSDTASRAMGAPMIEAGLWFRPSFFPRAGERTWRDACDREVAMVRGRVGVCDVSTLGKIEVAGPDAGAFLDFLYTGTMSKLAVGKVRYGLMLREDGHVMDDGTAARLGPDRFLVTTTTAAAGQVMAHAEFARQALRPDLDVALASVTEHWAQFAVAGPEAGRLAGAVVDEMPELSFMGCAEVEAMAGPALPDLVFGRDRLRDRGAGALRREPLPAARLAGRSAGRRRLRDGGAERHADREGVRHPRGDPRPGDGLRYRDARHDVDEEGLHRSGGGGAARASGGPRGARGAEARGRGAGDFRGRASFRGGRRAGAGGRRGLRDLGLLLADAREGAGAWVSEKRAGAARPAHRRGRRAEGSAHALRGDRPGGVRPRGGADAWLGSSRKRPSRGCCRWKPVGSR